jgi:UDP-N-acetylmuramoyl-tripeptide--D-alanyl-D-alanine ligase
MNAVAKAPANGRLDADRPLPWRCGRGARSPRRPAGPPAAISRSPASRSTAATCVPGDLFFALKGEAMDGHRFIDKRLCQGAPRRRWWTARSTARTCWSKIPQAALERWPQSRARARAGDRHRRDRLGRQDRGQGSDLRRARPRQPGRAHRSVKSYNNHVGVPLSLARMPARSAFGVFEMGMNHAGEIARADRAGPPARGA